MATAQILIILLGILMFAVLYLIIRGDRSRDELNQRLARVSEVAERLAQAQSELTGRVSQSQEGMNARLEALSKRVGDGLSLQTEKTGKTLTELEKRLAVIDAAQAKITDLSQQVVGLQDILSNKQARGAFGEVQLRDLVTGILPPSVYAFQASLSNGRRADCLLNLPNPPGPIVIDSKFPLESYYALRDAKDEAAQTAAKRGFGQAVQKHVKDIAERYIIPGETADSALMFLPAEAVYAELHAELPEIVDYSHINKVWIVSPTTMMATLNTIRAVLKDVHMREQAGVIQMEVQKMMVDVARLDDRVGKLQTHMRQADKDLNDIRISTEKITKRGEGISEIDVGKGSDAADIAPPEQPRQVQNDN